MSATSADPVTHIEGGGGVWIGGIGQLQKKRLVGRGREGDCCLGGCPSPLPTSDFCHNLCCIEG